MGLLVALGHPVRRGLGFDMSAKAIDLATHMAERLRTIQGQNCLSFQSHTVTAPWPAELFDVVCIIDVLHHVPPAEQRRVLEQASNCLAPGGHLIYKDMCRRPVWRALANRLHDLLVARQWIHYVPLERVETWAAECGLRLLHNERINRLWYGHELLVFRRDPEPA